MKYIKQISSKEQFADIPNNSVCMFSLENPTDADNIISDIASTSGASYGQITSFEGEKTYASFEAAEELNYVSAIGALLWKNNTDGTLLANNGDGSIWDYTVKVDAPDSEKDPADSDYTIYSNNGTAIFRRNSYGCLYDWKLKGASYAGIPEKTGYTLIAVCVGLGKWAYINWTGLDNPYKWAASSTDAIYTTNHGIMVHGDGYNNTNHILTTHADILTGTVWAQIKTLRDSNIPAYLTSKLELADIQWNTCSEETHKDTETSKGGKICDYTNKLGQLLGLTAGYYWSSSQYSDVGNYGGAFSVDFSNGYVLNSNKTYEYHSVVCLHFGA